MKKTITIEQMVKTGLFLSLLFITKFIQKFIPNLPNGLGDITVLIELLIVVGSIIVGWKYALSAVGIYMLFGLIDIPTFFGGLLWVQGITKFEVYLLDYFFPLIVLSLAGVFKKTWLHLAINVVVVNVINYLFHCWSGVVFWGSYAWSGWGAYAYSFAANAIKNGVMLAGSLIIFGPAYKVPVKLISKW